MTRLNVNSGFMVFQHGFFQKAGLGLLLALVVLFSGCLENLEAQKSLCDSLFNTSLGADEGTRTEEFCAQHVQGLIAGLPNPNQEEMLQKPEFRPYADILAGNNVVSVSCNYHLVPPPNLFGLWYFGSQGRWEARLTDMHVTETCGEEPCRSPGMCPASADLCSDCTIPVPTEPCGDLVCAPGETKDSCPTDCFASSLGGEECEYGGFTGPDAAPQLSFDQSLSGMTSNFCATNYCDAIQATGFLLKKMKDVQDTSEQPTFILRLMKSSFSPSFFKDAKEYFEGQFLTPSWFSDSQSPWKEFLSNELVDTSTLDSSVAVFASAAGTAYPMENIPKIWFYSAKTNDNQLTLYPLDSSFDGSGTMQLESGKYEVELLFIPKNGQSGFFDYSSGTAEPNGVWAVIMPDASNGVFPPHAAFEKPALPLVYDFFGGLLGEFGSQDKYKQYSTGLQYSTSEYAPDSFMMSPTLKADDFFSGSINKSNPMPAISSDQASNNLSLPQIFAVSVSGTQYGYPNKLYTFFAPSRITPVLGLSQEKTLAFSLSPNSGGISYWKRIASEDCSKPALINQACSETFSALPPILMSDPIYMLPENRLNLYAILFNTPVNGSMLIPCLPEQFATEHQVIKGPDQALEFSDSPYTVQTFEELLHWTRQGMVCWSAMPRYSDGSSRTWAIWNTEKLKEKLNELAEQHRQSWSSTLTTCPSDTMPRIMDVAQSIKSQTSEKIDQLYRTLKPLYDYPVSDLPVNTQSFTTTFSSYTYTGGGPYQQIMSQIPEKQDGYSITIPDKSEFSWGYAYMESYLKVSVWIETSPECGPQNPSACQPYTIKVALPALSMTLSGNVIQRTYGEYTIGIFSDVDPNTGTLAVPAVRSYTRNDDAVKKFAEWFATVQTS